MKKLIFSLILMFALLSTANAYVNVEQLEQLDLSKVQDMTIDVTTNESVLDFSVIVPNNIQLTSHNLTGTENYEFSSNSVVYMEQESTAYLWSFRDMTESNFKIELEISSETDGNIYSVWIYPPASFDSKTTEVSVKGTGMTPGEIGQYIGDYAVVLMIILISAGFIIYLVMFSKKQKKNHSKV